jgi:hypothetical protein
MRGRIDDRNALVLRYHVADHELPPLIAVQTFLPNRAMLSEGI